MNAAGNDEIVHRKLHTYPSGGFQQEIRYVTLLLTPLIEAADTEKFSLVPVSADKERK